MTLELHGRFINNFLGKDNTTTKICIELDGNVVKSDEIIANAFNNHFNVVGSKLGGLASGDQYLFFLKTNRFIRSFLRTSHYQK